MSSSVRQRGSKKQSERERRVAEGLPKKKLTKEEQEELEEKELEEACERWCSKIIRIVTLGSMAWGLLTPVWEWGTRPPVLIERVDLGGRTYVLTGGTDGIGAAAARQLALDGARVVLGSRDLSRGLAAAAALRQATGNDHVEARHLDLTNMSSVGAPPADTAARPPSPVPTS